MPIFYKPSKNAIFQEAITFFYMPKSEYFFYFVSLLIYYKYLEQISLTLNNIEKCYRSLKVTADHILAILQVCSNAHNFFLYKYIFIKFWYITIYICIVLRLYYFLMTVL